MTSAAACGLRDMKIRRWSGHNVTAEPYLVTRAIANGWTVRPSRPYNRGFVGAALSHIAVWSELTSPLLRDTDAVLILEDDVNLTPLSMCGVRWALEATGRRFDVINMCALRPCCEQFRPDLGLVRLPHPYELREPYVPNVWGSSYVLTVRGARRLMVGLRRGHYDLSVVQIDRLIVKVLARSTQASMYAVVDQRYFGHIESDSDVRALGGDWRPRTRRAMVNHQRKNRRRHLSARSWGIGNRRGAQGPGP